MFRCLLRLLFILPLLMTSFFSEAGIIIGGTRVVYISDKPDETISVVNKDESLPYLIQAWVEPFDSNDKSKPPFTVIPPVSRLDPRQEKRIYFLA